MILESTVVTKHAEQSTLIQIDANLVFCHEQPPLGHTPFEEESTPLLYLCVCATVSIKPEVRRLIL